MTDTLTHMMNDLGKLTEFSLFQGRHKITSVLTNKTITHSVYGAKVDDPNDFVALTNQAKKVIRHHKNEILHLYITSLTQGTTCFINAWIQLGCPGSLILYHYDRNTETYVPQIMMPPQDN